MRILAALGFSAVFILFSVGANAAGFPLVISATVDYTHNTLTISGQNFGSNPSVTLDALAFPTQSSASSQIVANFPSGKAPSSFTPGTYFLTVTFKNQLPTIFGVDIGANGAQGPAGPAGALGAAGASGATGPAGPAGPQGIPGPMGPPGATGPAGATGAPGLQGATGAQGPQGLQGPAGQQGPAGSNGTNGSGVPICDSSAPYLVISNGAMACRTRFYPNGDGTVTDNQTGLMWEIKTGTAVGTACTALADAHNVNNCYTWTSGANSRDGTLYTSFLATLNADVGIDVFATCFARHCDWRIPNLAELYTIFEQTAPECGSGLPCIDPVFGSTQSAHYWSSSSSGDALAAWTVDFSSTIDTIFSFGGTPPFSNYARAVRGGR
jgi:uncharacterized protein DUF1566/collagen triple helix repeat protein